MVDVPSPEVDRIQNLKICDSASNVNKGGQ